MRWCLVCMGYQGDSETRIGDVWKSLNNVDFIWAVHFWPSHESAMDYAKEFAWKPNEWEAVTEDDPRVVVELLAAV